MFRLFVVDFGVCLCSLWCLCLLFTSCLLLWFRVVVCFVIYCFIFSVAVCCVLCCVLCYVCCDLGIVFVVFVCLLLFVLITGAISLFATGMIVLFYCDC